MNPIFVVVFMVEIGVIAGESKTFLLYIKQCYLFRFTLVHEINSLITGVINEFMYDIF